MHCFIGDHRITLPREGSKTSLAEPSWSVGTFKTYDAAVVVNTVEVAVYRCVSNMGSTRTGTDMAPLAI